MRPLVLLFSCLALTASALEASDKPVVFEKWVRDTFFDGYKPAAHNPRWDIPASANSRHGGLPINVRLARQGAAADLGDALGQYEIDEPFILILGIWESTDGQPRLAYLLAPEIRPELWRQLWSPITYNDLLKLDALIKDPGLEVGELRRAVLKVKNTPPFNQAVIQVNPRITNDGQRRLYCSIRPADFSRLLAPGAERKAAPRAALWGVEFPGTVKIPPRAGN